MKNIFLNITLLTFSISLFAQIDRSIPEPDPAPQINFEEPISFEMKNGLKVMLIENHKLPRVSINLLIDNPPIFEGNLNGIGYLTGGIMGKGNEYQDKDSVNEEIDFMGARMSFSSQSGFASSLSRYFERTITMFSQSALNPSFTEEEFNQEKNILLDNIKNNEKNTVSIARRVENVLAYGLDHPYGEFTTKESMEKIELKNILKKQKPGQNGEIHITDAIQSLILDNNKFIGHNFAGKYLDCGTLKGYIDSSNKISKLWNFV